MLVARIADPSIDDERARDTFARARAVADGDPACASALGDALATATTCGRGATAVAIGLFGSERFPASSTADVVRRAQPSCEAAVLRGVHEARDVDASVVSAVRGRILEHGSPDERAPAWLALGSVAGSARASGRAALADAIDHTIDARLAAGAHGPMRVVFLSAAGNAGCARCANHLRASAHDPDATIRRAAAGAWRLVASAEAATTMCHAATTDDDATVRGEAAWALGFVHDRADDRVRCLLAVARTDASEGTRHAAVTALERLDAKGALRDLEDDEGAPADVRAAVSEHFMTTTRPRGERSDLR